MLDYIMFFFFNDTATTEIYTLSLHDALPISGAARDRRRRRARRVPGEPREGDDLRRRADRRHPGRRHREPARARSEEHTSELQSRQYLVCRLLLEKKKKQQSRPACNEAEYCH